MKRVGNFFKGLLPFLLVVALQIVVTLIVEVVCALGTHTRFADVAGAIAAGTTGATVQLINFVYGIVALLFFGLWYRGVFILPFKGKKKADQPTGFSFHTIMALLFLSIGLYYVTSLVVGGLGVLFPAWLEDYNAMIEDVGYTSPSVLLILYSVFLAPLVEEFAYRGLTMRYMRMAFPFWFANILQSLLFALLHGDLMQGAYAFLMGLFLGWVAHRGRGVKYSIVLHILFNAIGMWFSGIISLTLELNYAIAMLCGIALTIFALWLYWSDFLPEKAPGSKKSSTPR